ncbi:MAG: hypothetical protein ACI82G_001805 [Bradymonadia bacterium]|jgi:hypothetical protein
MPRYAAIAFTVSFLVACQPPSGDEGQPCYPNGTCDGNLSCFSGLCVEAPVSAIAAESSEVAPAPAPQVVTEAEPAAAPSAAAPTAYAAPAPATNPAEEAMEAYRSVIRAWNSGDELSYFGGYAEVVSCWYDRANRPIAEVRAGGRGGHFRDRTSSRLEIDRLEPIAANDDQVTFIEHGRLVGSSRTTSHDKLIVMRHGEAGWRIVVEGSPEQHSCWHEIPPGFAVSATGPDPQPSRTCRVLRIHTECQTTAGEPPCHDRRSYVTDPPVPPGSNRQQAEAALRTNEDNCEYGEPEFGPTGRVREVGGWCMGWGSIRHVYEGCD